MKKSIDAGILALCLVLLGGCVIISDNSGPECKNTHNEGSRVGGGFEITYLVSEDGVLNLVDRKSGKDLMSKSVEAGELYEFSAKALTAENAKEWGINLKKAEFVLYFHPKNQHLIAPRPPMMPVPPQAPEAPAPVQPGQ